MDLQPHQILRALQLGQADLIFASDTLWLCVSCQTCVTRCPCEVDLPRVMDALRAWAVLHRLPAAQREVTAFQRAFLKSIELTGRVYEAGLIGGYNLTSGHLFSSFDLAAPMLLKGKVRLAPQRVRAMNEVAGIFRRARALEAELARPEPAAVEKGGVH
jgi:heterodisulfide reductase subunit C